MDKIGSNQYRAKPKYRFFKSVLVLVLVISNIGLLGHLQLVTAKIISPVPKGYIYTKVIYEKQNDDIETYIRHVFGDRADEAIKIVNCESRFNPNAIGDHGKSIGLFQIHTGYHKIADRFLFNPKVNIQVAYQLFKDSGYKWTLWSCRKVL